MLTDPSHWEDRRCHCCCATTSINHPDSTEDDTDFWRSISWSSLRILVTIFRQKSISEDDWDPVVSIVWFIVMMYRQIPSKNLELDVRTVYSQEDIWSCRDTRQSRANHDDEENRDDIQSERDSWQDHYSILLRDRIQLPINQYSRDTLHR